MLRERAMWLAFDLAQERKSPVAILKGRYDDATSYAVEINIEQINYLPENLVAIFWPGKKMLVNARPKNFDERAASMRARTENEWVCIW